jgi:hypothetical protein
LNLSFFGATKISRLKELLPVLANAPGSYFEDEKLFASLRGKWFEISLTDELDLIAVGEIEGGECTWADVAKITPVFNCQQWVLLKMALRCFERVS